jgi:hypothetical protein
MSVEPRELSEIAASVLKAMIASRMIETGGKAVRIVTEWSVAVEKGSADIEIREFATPEQRCRRQIAARMRDDARAARRGSVDAEVGA